MHKLRRLADLLLLAFVLSGLVSVVIPAIGSELTVSAQTDAGHTEDLTARVARLESRATTSAGAAVTFLFGAFCALWAQNTKRNPWQWFFVGMFFNVIAVLVLLAKNADDLRGEAGAAAAASRTVILAVVLGALLLISFFLLYWRNV